MAASLVPVWTPVTREADPEQMEDSMEVVGVALAPVPEAGEGGEHTADTPVAAEAALASEGAAPPEAAAEVAAGGAALPSRLPTPKRTAKDMDTSLVPTPRRLDTE